MVDVKFSMFFDRAHVAAKVKDGTRSALSKAGAFVRRTAKGLIRAGKKIAKPGKPPKSHLGWLKKLLFFGYDNESESVVVGPQLFKTSHGHTAPELLEFGGTTTNDEGQEKIYHQFPFMNPALVKEAPKFPDLFADCVRD